MCAPVREELGLCPPYEPDLAVARSLRSQDQSATIRPVANRRPVAPVA